MAFGDIIQNQSEDNVLGSDTSITVTLSSTPTEGNLGIALHFTGDGNSIAPSGWSEAVALTDGTNTDQGAIYYKVFGSGESTAVTCGSDGADEHMLTVLEVEGPWNASPLDQTASTAAGTGTTRSSGTTGTTAQNDEFAAVLITHRVSTDPDMSNWTNSFIERSDSGVATLSKNIGTASRLLTSTGTYETTADLAGNSNSWSMGGIATFKKQAAVVGRPPELIIPVRRPAFPLASM